MKLLDVKEANKMGQYYEYYRDDDMNLIRITVTEDGEQLNEEDMQECACFGCWENR